MITNAHTDPPAPVVVDAAQVRASLPFAKLIPMLQQAFIAGAKAPLRVRHALPDGASLLIMPAWHGQTTMGVKIVSVFPANGALELPAVSATYILCDGRTGQHLAVIDGRELTGRRTAAASALAGAYLAREDAAELLVVGAGHIASLMPEAWATIRPITRVRVWNVRPERAIDLAVKLRLAGIDATVAKDIRAAVQTADIISCATLSLNPIVSGAWLQPGAHLDLIGGFTPAMREADDEAISRSRVYIDTEAALAEAGDLTQPISRGLLSPAAIAGTLAGLCRGEVTGRTDPDTITMFKSVGTALEDLAAATLVHRTIQANAAARAEGSAHEATSQPPGDTSGPTYAQNPAS